MQFDVGKSGTGDWDVGFLQYPFDQDNRSDTDTFCPLYHEGRDFPLLFTDHACMVMICGGR